VSVSDVVLISGCRLFHANGSATVKLRGPKPGVLVHGKPGHFNLPSTKGETALIINTRWRVKVKVLYICTECYLPYVITQCYMPPTQVNTPALTRARQASTQFTYPGGMEGW